MRSTNDHSTCHKCGKPATIVNGTAPKRRIQNLPIFDKPVYLEIVPVRYRCEHCDGGPTTTEQYDWVDRNASITTALQDYILRSLINSTVQDVAIKSCLGYKVIQAALDRLVTTEVDWDGFSKLGTLGIDEIALKKGHDSYMTIVSVRQGNGKVRVVAVLEGRDKVSVKSFLESVPATLRATVKTVCTDMYDGYVNAAMEMFGPRAVVVDRYHVAKLYRKPLDELRIKEMARLKEELDEAQYAKLNGMMWILRKQHECLSKEDKVALELLYRYSPKLKKAHQFALKLTCIFNAHSNRKSGLAKFNRWISAVEKSDLICFNRFISTLKKYMPFIANYLKSEKIADSLRD